MLIDFTVIMGGAREGFDIICTCALTWAGQQKGGQRRRARAARATASVLDAPLKYRWLMARESASDMAMNWKPRAALAVAGSRGQFKSPEAGDGGIEWDQRARGECERRREGRGHG